jgi:hypothetical protein
MSEIASSASTGGAAFAHSRERFGDCLGVTNPQVTQSNIKANICKKGWTKTVRPPVQLTDSLKVKQIAEYHYADPNPERSRGLC